MTAFGTYKMIAILVLRSYVPGRQCVRGNVGAAWPSQKRVSPQVKNQAQGLGCLCLRLTVYSILLAIKKPSHWRGLDDNGLSYFIGLAPMGIIA